MNAIDDLKKGKINLMGVVGLGPKKNPIPSKYATFNHRMMAATLDSFLLLMTIAPFIDVLFVQLYPPIQLSDAAIARVQGQPEGFPALVALFSEMVSSGAVGRWFLHMSVQALTLCVFNAFCWHYWAATPGKMIMRLRVVDAETEQPISDRQIAARIAGYFVSMIPLMAGFMAISFNKRRQGWHDRMARTVVVVKPLPERLQWKNLWAAAKVRMFKRGSPAGNPSNSPEPSKAE